MNISKNAGGSNGGELTPVSVAWTTVSASTSRSLQNADKCQFSSLGLSGVFVGGIRGGGGGGGGNSGIVGGVGETHQHICCGRLFSTSRLYQLHLAEKATNDATHERKLKEMGFLQCSLCSVFVQQSSMSQHLKKAHGVIKVNKAPRVVPVMPSEVATDSNLTETTIKSGKNYVIKVSGQTLAAGQSFVVGSSGKSLLERSTAGVVMAKPPSQVISSSSSGLYPGKVIVRHSKSPNLTVPVVTYGPRILMKASPKINETKKSLTLVGKTNVHKIPTSSSMLHTNSLISKSGKGVTSVKITGGSIVANSENGQLVKVATPLNPKRAKPVTNVNKKGLNRTFKVISRTLSSKVDDLSKESLAVISSTLPDDFLANESDSEEKNESTNVNSVSEVKPVTQMCVAEESETLNSRTNEKNKKDPSVFSPVKNYSESTKVNLDDSTDIFEEFAISLEKIQKEKEMEAKKVDDTVEKHQKKKVMVNKKTDSIVKQDELSTVKVPHTKGREKSNGNETVGNKKPNKKRRKQILKPVCESEQGEFGVETPYNSKVKVKKKGKNILVQSETVTPKINRKTSPNLLVTPKKSSKKLKENKCDNIKNTPKTSRQGSRGGRVEKKKSRPVGRPRKETKKINTPDLTELGNLFDEDVNEDLENDPNLVEKNEKDENVPTVELEMFTLSSLNEQVSVLLLDPHNPNFKVYASMDAIFVGDSALGDVTNQVGYVTDSNTVVFVNPGHFLFPNVKELDKFVPRPILTVKEKKSTSPKKICKLNTGIKPSLCNSNENRLVKKNLKGSMCLKESLENDKKQVNSPLVKKKHSPSESSKNERVRRRSARLSGDNCDGSEMVPLVLNKDEEVSNRGKGVGEMEETKSKKKLPDILSSSVKKIKKVKPLIIAQDKISSGVGCTKELKVMISPIKLEFQNLVKEFKKGVKKSPLKHKVALTFNSDEDDDGVKVCHEELSGKNGMKLKSDNVAPFGVGELTKETTVRSRTRTRSADSAACRKASSIDYPPSDKNSLYNCINKRKGRLKSESDIPRTKLDTEEKGISKTKENSQSLEENDVKRLNLECQVNDSKSKSISSSGCVSLSESKSKSVSSGGCVSLSEKSKLTSSDTCQNLSGKTKSLVELTENSVIGKNSVVTNVSYSLTRMRPIRERRPSSKWLESVALGKHFKKSNPRLRTERSASDITNESSVEKQSDISDKGNTLVPTVEQLRNEGKALDVSIKNKIKECTGEVKLKNVKAASDIIKDNKYDAEETNEQCQNELKFKTQKWLSIEYDETEAENETETPIDVSNIDTESLTSSRSSDCSETKKSLFSGESEVGSKSDGDNLKQVNGKITVQRKRKRKKNTVSDKDSASIKDKEHTVGSEEEAVIVEKEMTESSIEQEHSVTSILEPNVEQRKDLSDLDQEKSSVKIMPLYDKQGINSSEMLQGAFDCTVSERDMSGREQLQDNVSALQNNELPLESSDRSKNNVKKSLLSKKTRSSSSTEIRNRMDSNDNSISDTSSFDNVKAVESKVKTDIALLDSDTDEKMFMGSLEKLNSMTKVKGLSLLHQEHLTSNETEVTDKLFRELPNGVSPAKNVRLDRGNTRQKSKNTSSSEGEPCARVIRIDKEITITVKQEQQAKIFECIGEDDLSDEKSNSLDGFPVLSEIDVLQPPKTKRSKKKTKLRKELRGKVTRATKEKNVSTDDRVLKPTVEDCEKDKCRMSTAEEKVTYDSTSNSLKVFVENCEMMNERENKEAVHTENEIENKEAVHTENEIDMKLNSRHRTSDAVVVLDKVNLDLEKDIKLLHNDDQGMKVDGEQKVKARLGTEDVDSREQTETLHCEDELVMKFNDSENEAEALDNHHLSPRTETKAHCKSDSVKIDNSNNEVRVLDDDPNSKSDAKIDCENDIVRNVSVIKADVEVSNNDINCNAERVLSQCESEFALEVNGTEHEEVITSDEELGPRAETEISHSKEEVGINRNDTKIEAGVLDDINLESRSGMELSQDRALIMKDGSAKNDIEMPHNHLNSCNEIETSSGSEMVMKTTRREDEIKVHGKDDHCSRAKAKASCEKELAVKLDSSKNGLRLPGNDYTDYRIETETCEGDSSEMFEEKQIEDVPDNDQLCSKANLKTFSCKSKQVEDVPDLDSKADLEKYPCKNKLNLETDNAESRDCRILHSNFDITENVVPHNDLHLDFVSGVETSHGENEIVMKVNCEKEGEEKVPDNFSCLHSRPDVVTQDDEVWSLGKEKVSNEMGNDPEEADTDSKSQANRKYKIISDIEKEDNVIKANSDIYFEENRESSLKELITEERTGKKNMDSYVRSELDKRVCDSKKDNTDDCYVAEKSLMKEKKNELGINLKTVSGIADSDSVKKIENMKSVEAVASSHQSICASEEFNSDALNTVCEMERKKSPGKVPKDSSSPRSTGSLSPGKGCVEWSPTREWHGRGAKLRAQVLIQDQQTGVMDSHIVSAAYDQKLVESTESFEKSLSLKNEKGKSPVSLTPKSPKCNSVLKSPKVSVVSPSSVKGISSKSPKTPKSPKVIQEDREWQARGAKLKAQIMISDQQSGQLHTSVELPENKFSPVLKSPPTKRAKLDRSPLNMKDIRSFFTVQKTPEHGHKKLPKTVEGKSPEIEKSKCTKTEEGKSIRIGKDKSPKIEKSKCTKTEEGKSIRIGKDKFTKIEKNDKATKIMEEKASARLEEKAPTKLEEKTSTKSKEDKFHKIKEDEKSPIKEDGKSSIIKEDEKSPIIKEGEKSPIIKEGEKSPIIKEGEKSPTLKEGEKSPTLKEGKKSPIIKEGEKSPIIKEGEKSPTLKEGEKSPTLQEGEKSPIIKEGKKSPIIKEGEKYPVIKEVEKSPVIKEVEKSPVIKEGEKSPVIKEVEKSPVIKESEKSPLVKGDEKSPIIKEDEKSPIIKEDEKSPIIKEGEKSPIIKAVNSSPIIEVDQESAKVEKRKSPKRDDTPILHCKKEKAHQSGNVTVVTTPSTSNSGNQLSPERIDMTVAPSKSVMKENPLRTKSTNEHFSKGVDLNNSSSSVCEEIGEDGSQSKISSIVCSPVGASPSMKLATPISSSKRLTSPSVNKNSNKPSSRKRKLNLYSVTSSDIRTFFAPITSLKRKLEESLPSDDDNSCKVVKRELSVESSSAELPKTKDVPNVHPLQVSSQSSQMKIDKEINLQVSSRSSQVTVAEKLNLQVSPQASHVTVAKELDLLVPSQSNQVRVTEELDLHVSSQSSQVQVAKDIKVKESRSSLNLDFEGFSDKSRQSGLRAKSLGQVVSLLERKRWSGLGSFSFPIDQLCEWDDAILESKIFDKIF